MCPQVRHLANLGLISGWRYLRLVAMLLCSVVVFVASTQDALADDEGLAFIGTAPPIPNSEAILLFPVDIQTGQRFAWISSDSILGRITTGGLIATVSWNVIPGPGNVPDRIVFTATYNDVAFHGDVLLGNEMRGVIDVTRGFQRVRYLLIRDPTSDDYQDDLIGWGCAQPGSSALASVCPPVLQQRSNEPACADEDSSCHIDHDDTENNGPDPFLTMPAPNDRADIRTDISTLIDGAFVERVKAFKCGTDALFTPYFPGIQAYNDTDLNSRNPRDVVHAQLAGDAPTAELYLKFARQGSGMRKSEIRDWSLLYYYNGWRKEAVGNSNDNPLTVTPLNPEQGVVSPGTNLYARKNRVTERLAMRGPPNNDVTNWGDQLETRMLGIWASASTEAKFKAHDPEFTAVIGNTNQPDPAQRTRDQRDFQSFFADTVDNAEWKEFMYRASWEVATAFKCGRRVFEHSGGGAVIGFVMRLLDTNAALRVEIKQWRPQGKFVVIGLEAVLSEELVNLLNGLESYKPATSDELQQGARTLVKNYIAERLFRVDDEGSVTWRKTIVPQILSVDQHPITSRTLGIPLEDAGRPLLPNFFRHGRIAFYVLKFGSLPGREQFPSP